MFGTGINNGSCYWINHFSVDDYDTEGSEYILRELIFFKTFKERFEIVFHHLIKFHQKFLCDLFQYDISVIMLASW